MRKVKFSSRNQYKVLEPRYKKLSITDKCFYCGDIYEEIDHIPALAIAYALGPDNLEEKGIEFFKVSSCRECNSLLNGLMLLTIQERAEYLYDKIQHKYKSTLKSRHWYHEDIEEDEFSGQLKDYLLAQADIRLWVEKRLEYLETVFSM